MQSDFNIRKKAYYIRIVKCPENFPSVENQLSLPTKSKTIHPTSVISVLCSCIRSRKRFCVSTNSLVPYKNRTRFFQPSIKAKQK